MKVLVDISIAKVESQPNNLEKRKDLDTEM